VCCQSPELKDRVLSVLRIKAIDLNRYQAAAHAASMTRTRRRRQLTAQTALTRQTAPIAPSQHLPSQKHCADRSDTGRIGDLRRRAIHSGAGAALAGFTVDNTALDNGAITNPCRSRRSSHQRQQWRSGRLDGCNRQHEYREPTTCTAQPSISTRVPRCRARMPLCREAMTKASAKGGTPSLPAAAESASRAA